MVQIWKQELRNVKYNEAQKQDYKLPAIVLYNGGKPWHAVMRFKDLQNGAERFGGHMVDFEYILVNVNQYDEKDLLKVANAISCVIMMDQTMVAKDKNVMIWRLNKIVQMKDQLAPEKMEIIIEWLIEVFSRQFPKEETQKIIKSLKEEKNMTYAIERLFESVREEEREKGELKKAINIAKEMLLDGEPVEKIMRYTKLAPEKIEELKAQI